MVRQYIRRFPAHKILSTPKKKLDKQQGPYKHRLAQQGKLLDDCLCKLIEDAIVQKFQGTSRRVARGVIRAHVNKLHAQQHAIAKQALLTAKPESLPGLPGIRKP